MFIELFEPLTGGQWVFKIVATLKDNGQSYVLLQKANLDVKAELYRVLGDPEEIDESHLEPVDDEEEWKRVIATYQRQVLRS